MIYSVEAGNLLIVKETLMKDSGKTMKRMVKVLKNGLPVILILGLTWVE